MASAGDAHPGPPLKVGVTGGIGSGKSMVCRILALLGVPIFYADEEAKRLMRTDERLRTALKKVFGDAAFPPGDVHRQALAAFVFKDAQALERMQALVHPAVREAFVHWTATQRAPYVVMEAAILVETGGDSAMDRLVVVSAPETLRIRRVMERDGWTEQQVLARMAAQATDAYREAAAHRVIRNDEARLLIPQVLEVHAWLLNER